MSFKELEDHKCRVTEHYYPNKAMGQIRLIVFLWNRCLLKSFNLSSNKSASTSPDGLGLRNIDRVFHKVRKYKKFGVFTDEKVCHCPAPRLSSHKPSPPRKGKITLFR
ncbi:hypothetical protein JOC86_004397 [Bacillus pakistanensis]|uniref:Uncharacterized protein n=1 Tax=Rossellomorea pakistanensis TaxID=992288 RepID=A0ABS2NIX3_9BACI|nr:hypothetical protein [Bacillus pakistanensis]